MGENKPYLRVVAFAGVLILVGGLVMGLFNEARAVDMSFDNPPDSVSSTGQATFTTHITIPDTERVPIDEIHAIVEQQDADRNDKVGSDVVTRVGCTMTGQAGHTCNTGEFSPEEGEASNGVTQIEIANFYAGSVAAENTVDSAYIFGHEDGAYYETTGYGYDDTVDVPGVGGYGYGHDLDSRTTYSSFDGYGYGYDGDSLIIEVKITVSGSNLGSLSGSDTFYLTVLGDTGSATLGDISSPFHEFTLTSGGATPGGGGGGGGGGAAARTVDLGVAADFARNEWVQITDLPNGYDMLRLQFAQACDGCTVRMEVHGNSPPSGTSALANSWNPLEYFSIWVEGPDGDELEGYVDEATLEFEVDADDLNDDTAAQVSLTHNIDGEWQAEDTRLTNDADDDPLNYNATISGFSVFAQAVDTEGPQFSNTQPTGTVQATTPSVSADWEDNRGIDTDSFELTIDGDTADDTTGSLTVNQDGFTYTPGTGFDEGEHQVEATVSDESGLSTTETWTFTVQEPECPEPPELTNPQPADGATDVTFDQEVSISFAEGSCAIEAGELIVAGETVDTGLEDGELSGQIPDTVEAGQQVNVTATVTDTAGNDAARQWTFTMSDEPGQPGDDGGGALVWVIVALVVIAIVGVGAYFYTQQE